MTQSTPAPAAAPMPAVPEEFIDPQTGAIRTEALLTAYLALRDRPAPAVPETPDGYRVTPPHALLEPDPAVNARLHAAGFTPEQVQLVYDLAAETVIPVLESLAAEMNGDRELTRLVEHFGGEERWGEISRQLMAWGKASLPEDVLTALSGTAEGVLALHRMMQSGEPGLGGLDGKAPGAANEDEIKALMRDPKYWRDRDPSAMRKVAEGFQRLYPGQS